MHLDIPNKEVKKQNIKKLKRTSIFRTLNKIQRENMKKYHHSFCHDAVYDLMKKRCILMRDGKSYELGYDLLLGDVYNEMLEIYKNNGDHMDFYHIKDFNPINLMFFRNEVSEC